MKSILLHVHIALQFSIPSMCCMFEPVPKGALACYIFSPKRNLFRFHVSRENFIIFIFQYVTMIYWRLVCRKHDQSCGLYEGGRVLAIHRASYHLDLTTLPAVPKRNIIASYSDELRITCNRAIHQN